MNTLNEIARLQRIVENQNRALNHWRETVDQQYMKNQRLAAMLNTALPHLPTLVRAEAERVLETAKIPLPPPQHV